ncbi:Hint domain-containing protein [uncultured Lentibacter sp.]|jgi:hypothetical protein|uniref:Hint domain-containing protein n=1 Tax=uncultured Lentibacter sp. TaxID=1659309 RepID=UPI00261D2AA7|nr:Hint domain-containing protein [uncultured Lentibacter sp.]
MDTGFQGTFVISWPQTKLGGLANAPVTELGVGTTWSWEGEAVRVDGPSHVLRLGRADDEGNLRRRAARMVQRLVGMAHTGHDPNLHRVNRPENSVNTESAFQRGALEHTALAQGASERDEHEALEAFAGDNSFVVTDGTKSYTVTLIEIGGGAQPLVMFVNQLPPKACDLWVVHHSLRPSRLVPQGDEAGGVICFTSDTRIETPEGPRAVQALRPGDYVLTKDSGAQQIQWVGQRQMSGARLFAMPHLRPIRFRAGALGVERPDQELVVSPEHRMLVRGAAARALFNTSEVLVRAKDLLNGRTIVIDSQMRTVSYVHLLLPKHEIVWANGVETESFHPANTALASLSAEDRARLLQMRPDFELQPERYGAFARRNLSASDAAILAHEAA